MKLSLSTLIVCSCLILTGAEFLKPATTAEYESDDDADTPDSDYNRVVAAKNPLAIERADEQVDSVLDSADYAADMDPDESADFATLSRYMRELSPVENNCRLVKSTRGKYKAVCSRVPRYCRQVCDALRRLEFDAGVARVRAHSFAGYEVRRGLELAFTAAAEIDAGAFGGLTVAADTQLRVTLAPAGAGRGLDVAGDAFRGVKLETGARLVVKIGAFDRVEFKNGSLLGVEHSSSASTQITVSEAGRVLFRSECAKGWRAAVPDEDERSDPPASVMFRVGLNDVGEVVFEKESFAELRQAEFGLFQLVLARFGTCKIGRASFAGIRQARASNFELNLAQGRSLQLSERVFERLVQAQRSKFVFFVGVNESSVCVRADTFGSVTQSDNSTLRITFLLSQRNSLVFGAKALNGIQQRFNSFVQIYVLKPDSFVLESESVSNLTQNTMSFFEIWVSKARQSFAIRASAFKRVEQGANSSLRIGFTSSTEDSSFFQQAPGLFSQFISHPTAETVYDFTQGTNFNLRLPVRTIPRMMPLNDESASGKTIEEIAYKLFPNLGRQSRPDRISLADYLLSSNDFCKVVDIPFDVLVRLRPETECSCSVYYLYRIARLIHPASNSDNWLNSTPECYRRKFLSTSKPDESANDYTIDYSAVEPNSVDNAIAPPLVQVRTAGSPDTNNDLKSLEAMCKFGEMAANCKLLNIDEPSESSLDSLDKLAGECGDASFDVYSPDEPVRRPAPSTQSDEDYTDIDSSDEASKSDGGVLLPSEEELSGAVVPDEEVVYDEDEDTEEDHDDELDSNGKLIEAGKKPTPSVLDPVAAPGKPVSALGNLFRRSSMLGFFIIAITSTILVGIVVFVAVIVRFRHKDEFVEYGEDDDDDDDDDGAGSGATSDEDEPDEKRNQSQTKGQPKNSSIFSPIHKKLEHKKQFSYSVLENSKPTSRMGNKKIDKLSLDPTITPNVQHQPPALISQFDPSSYDATLVIKQTCTGDSEFLTPNNMSIKANPLSHV